MPIAKIRKRDGRIVEFNPERIKSAIHRAFVAVKLENGEKAEKLTGQVVNLLEERFRDKIPSVEDAQDAVVEVLKKNGFEEVASEYQAYRRKKEEIRQLREKLGIEEPKLTVNALEVLRKRYLLKDENERVVEEPAQMFRRVAKAIARIDKRYGENPEESEEIFYRMMARLEFLPNSPTLFNAGTKLGQLSACFVLPVEDSLSSIFTAVKNMALIEKSGGGVGFDFSRLRPKGDIVMSTKGVASGPVSFMRVFDVATEVIKAGGRRRGAMMGILRIDHPDILEFVKAKQKPGLLSNFNVSVAVTDEFMKTLSEDGEYWLINPRNKEKTVKLKAGEVWSLMAKSAWASGDPGVIFIDEINRHNPTPEVGKIESTNPCVPGDVWVMTSEGPRMVADLVGKKFNAVVNGEKWKSSAEGFFPTEIKPVYRLTTKEGFEIDLTIDHAVMKVKRLTGYKMEAEWVKVGDLKKGDKILLNNHNGGENSWKGKFTFEEGYLTGLLLGNGTFKKDDAVLISRGEDEGAKTVRELAYSYAKNLLHRSDFTGWTCVKGRSEYHMNLGYLRGIAQEIGLKPVEKTVTRMFETASSDFYRGLIRGLFDCSGSVQGNPEKGVSIRLIQSSLELLKTVQRMLLRLGIKSKIYKNRQLGDFSKMPNVKGKMKNYPGEPQHKLIISRENILRFDQKIGFGDVNRKKQLESLLKTYKRRLKRETFLATFEKITYLGKEQVFDVKIPGKNAFDANGFYIHNCGEQPLLPYESCNLGSINLSRMVENGEILWNKLRETVGNAVHFLDNVIDANRYPLKQIEKVTKANRKIGLGVMGFADMLIKLGIPYSSEQALNLAEKLMRFIDDEAHRKSEEIAEKRGSFPNFEKSVWKDKYKAMRNATVTTIAPTGSISIIAGCSSGIEPLFAISFIRNVLDGTRLFETNPLFEITAKERGFYNAQLLEEIAKTGSVQKIDRIPEDLKKVFVTALDIKPEWHVKMQAAFQKYTDNAVSKTVNMPYEATVEDVRKVFELAWKYKCKGITVFRYGSKQEQVLYIGQVKTAKKTFVSAESEYAGGCPAKTCPFPE
ncbi:MAG: ribonucleotide reductase N-terminal alpha domain-containing protein [Candidatus Bathyarchaeia archaeon]